MRHKILHTVEQTILANPITLEGACQVDETYVLECEKGRGFSEHHHREPRTNGTASRPGLSAEYICLCTSYTSQGKCIAYAVNRATPSKDEIKQVFEDRVEDDTILLVDGNKSYGTLKDCCIVMRVENEDKVQINRFHSFIKERLRKYRGVATIYLNRYAALFSETFGKSDEACDKIFELMVARNKSHTTLDAIFSQGLLEV
jgi:transposase-like protein